jgi:streptomycin 6-kinase
MVTAIASSQRLVLHLLQTQTDLRPLHGVDHDNLSKTQRGFCAFDAKGKQRGLWVSVSVGRNGL